jgi:hypothetical protein
MGGIERMQIELGLEVGRAGDSLLKSRAAKTSFLMAT